MNYSSRKLCTVAIVFIIITECLSPHVYAQIETARIFGNGMVLQRDIDIRIWGTAGSGDKVLAVFNLKNDTAITDEKGRWEVNFPAMSAGGPYTLTLESNNESVTYSDIYIGDVWLASGQSNMAMPLSESNGGKEEAASACYPTIRQLLVKNTLGPEPVDDIPEGSGWTTATPEYAGGFSAVAYYFARDLQKNISIPVGIINASQGGVRIETFMSEEMLGFDEKDVELADGKPRRQPTLAYNTMIHPLVKLPVKGVIWYQGESNCDNLDDAVSYNSLFKRLIVSWRELWGMGDIPFLWIQLPNRGKPAVESKPGAWDAWPQLRAAQSKALSLPNTGEAVTIDVGEEDIHPANKEPVGHRLSIIARKIVYGEDMVYSGPRYKSHSVLEDGRVKITFDHAGGGLLAKNTAGDSLRWFSVSASDGTLVQAKAVIDGNSVIVWSDSVADPVIVRYAWEYNPEKTNFYNAEGLPAVPFLINIVHPGFVISSFTSSAATLERGENAILTWKAYGASSVTLNDEFVDSVDGIRIWPDDTATYMLKAINRLNPEDRDSAVITINVIEPLPVIAVSSDLGDLVEPGREIALIADAYTKGGNSVRKVDFYMDGVLLLTDSLAPYEAKWTPDTTGIYTISATVTDNNGVSVESAPLEIEISSLRQLVFEAENATFTGGGAVSNNDDASKGQYLDMTDAWVVIFNGINLPQTKEYQLSIKYMLNYGSPKNQILIVNDKPFSPVEFKAQSTTTWMTYRINIPLRKGENKIAIAGDWNWMSFDYIAIAIEETTE